MFDKAFKTVSLLSYQVFAEDVQSINTANEASKRILISTINPHSFYVAEHDPLFKEALQNSDVLLPDGVGIVWANWLINFSKIKKISGIDVFLSLLKKMEASSNPAQKKAFFLGSSTGNLAVIEAKIKSEYPSLQVATYSPPYKDEFSNEELRDMIEKINSFQPHALFIGMTAPKQEKWAYLHRNSVDARIICSIGAVFDFYSGRIERPGVIWQRLGLEWLGRFSKEPRRLWRRYLISLPYFIACVFTESLRKIVKRKK